METESLDTCWYTICNPTSGGGIKQNKIDRILSYLKEYQISYKFTTTQYPHQEEERGKFIMVAKTLIKRKN